MTKDMTNDDTSKLIIYGLGIAIIAFFGYLIYEKFRQTAIQPPSQPVTASLPSQHSPPTAGLQMVEQRLLQLENKIDKFQKSVSVSSVNPSNTLVQPNVSNQPEQSDRNVVSLPKYYNHKPSTKTMKLTDAELNKLTQLKFDMR